MIVKKNLDPIKVLSYGWQEVTYSAIIAIIVYLAYKYLPGGSYIALPFVPIGIVGSAVAIFVAFRNNSSYNRWWEARQIWGTLINSSRTFARQLTNFLDAHPKPSPGEVEQLTAFKEEMILRHIAFVHALRMHLRRQDDWQEIRPYLTEADYTDFMEKQNKPHWLLSRQGERIYETKAQGMLSDLESFHLENCLIQFADDQGACERIKNTPIPRQYDVFTRVFVWVFATALPFGLLSLFPEESGLTFITIPVSILIAVIFAIMEKTGSVIENPFENKVTDIPISALSNTIERDLKEQIGMQLPPKLQAVDGYLF